MLFRSAEKWVCVPTKRVRIVSVEEKVLGMTINRHKLITDEVQIQTKLGTQPLKATIRARLEPASPTVIKVVMERPNVEPGGHPALSAIRDLLLRLFQIDVNKYFEQQLIKAIDPKILQAGIPEEFKKLNLKITKAAFVDVGSLGIEVDA